MKVFMELMENNIFVIFFECTVTLIVTYGIARAVKQISKKRGRDGLHHRFLTNVIVAVIWIIGITTAMEFVPKLSSLTHTLLAGSGIVAVVIGLAAQESFGNLLSGLFLSLFKPFEIGDRVKLVKSGITGYVENITLRHTVIRTFINSRVIIPNSVIGSELIENSDYGTTVASSFLDIMIAYESDLKLAMEIMAEVIGSHELYLDQRTPEDVEKGVPKVQVLVRELGDNGISLRASMWTRTVNENFTACSDARIRIMKEFKEHNIEIPYNKLILVGQNPEEEAERPEKEAEKAADRSSEDGAHSGVGK